MRKWYARPTSSAESELIQREWFALGADWPTIDNNKIIHTDAAQLFLDGDEITAAREADYETGERHILYKSGGFTIDNCIKYLQELKQLM